MPLKWAKSGVNLLYFECYDGGICGELGAFTAPLSKYRVCGCLPGLEVYIVGLVG